MHIDEFKDLFYKDTKNINTNNSFIFNSVPSFKKNPNNLWQHFYGIEIETQSNFFNEDSINLMDFDCEQRNSVHFKPSKELKARVNNKD